MRQMCARWTPILMRLTSPTMSCGWTLSTPSGRGGPCRACHSVLCQQCRSVAVIAPGPFKCVKRPLSVPSCCRRCAALRRYFTWDKNLFPDPVKLQEEVASHGRKVVTIIDPHIKRDPGYYIYQEAEQSHYFVKDKDGKDFDGCDHRPLSMQAHVCLSPATAGTNGACPCQFPSIDFRWCWPGSSSYLDMLNPAVRGWWAQQFSLSKYKGSPPNLYVWNDMNEPSVFNGPEVRSNNVYFPQLTTSQVAVISSCTGAAALTLPWC